MYTSYSYKLDKNYHQYRYSSPIVISIKKKHKLGSNKVSLRLNTNAMGGIQRAGTGKNKKVTEISTLLAFWPEGLGIKFL